MQLQEMEQIFGHTDGRTNGRTDGRTGGWTDRRGSRNSYLDNLNKFVRSNYYTKEDLTKKQGPTNELHK